MPGTIVINDDLIPLLEHSLTLLSRRQEIIAGNLANLDTPFYTRKDLDFQKLLNSYLHGGPKVGLTLTHVAHIPGNGMPGGVIQDTGTTVDLDREMVEMAQNHLLFQASVQMLSKKLESLRTVLEGERR
jgi:flagellar basal-body rod protein FlgB